VPHSKVSWIAASLMAVATLGVLPLGSLHSGGILSPQIAQAQNFGQRTLQGKVLDDREAPIGGATIFLKNLKTRNVKSFTSTPDGSFRFAQVGMVDDYEVWAEQGKKKSSVKTISSFDSRKQLDFDLKLK
jgi:Carboxypeptidase regulatory-like domain